MKLMGWVLLSGRDLCFRKCNKFFCKSFFSYTFSTFSDAVHELEPKKWVYEFLVTSDCLLSRKVLWAVRIGSFWSKIEAFYRPEWTKGGTTWKLILSIFSSVVNEAIEKNSIFFKKNFCNTKYKTSKNQLTK